MSKRLAALLAIALLGLAVVGLTGCGSSAPTATTQPEVSAPEPEPEPEVTEPAAEETTELKIEDVKEGTGAAAKSGDTVTVHYTGYLSDGTKFESSKDSGQPFTFTIGENKVIPGWEQGVPGMKVGGTRKLTIPPDMAYGEAGAGGVIPPNATLVFEIDLVSID